MIFILKNTPTCFPYESFSNIGGSNCGRIYCGVESLSLLWHKKVLPEPCTLYINIHAVLEFHKSCSLLKSNSFWTNVSIFCSPNFYQNLWIYIYIHIHVHVLSLVRRKKKLWCQTLPTTLLFAINLLKLGIRSYKKNSLYFLTDQTQV